MRERVYTIEWTALAHKEFDKIKDAKLKDKILKVIETEVAANPLAGKPLTFVFKGVRSYRVGYLRILYKFYQDRLVIVILRIAHRKAVYRLN